MTLKKNPEDFDTRGRPPKYEGEVTIRKVYDFISTMTIEDFFSFCGVEQIAMALDINADTVYEWAKTYPEFSEAIKSWKTKRNSFFLKLAPNPQVNPAKWIFLAKNWLGMSDWQRVDTTAVQVDLTHDLKEFLNEYGIPNVREFMAILHDGNGDGRRRLLAPAVQPDDPEDDDRGPETERPKIHD